LIVRHLSEGTLRRLHDDRFAASNNERAHLAKCARCGALARRVGDDAARAIALLGPTAEAQGLEAALSRVRERAGSGAGGRDRMPAPPPQRRRRRLVLGGIAVPMVVAALVVSANAAGWLTVFAPTQVAPITLAASDLAGLPDLSAYGHMQVRNLDEHSVVGAAAAAAQSGLTVLQPSSLPAGVPAGQRWEVVSQGTAVFTLDAASAGAAAARAGRPAPVIPAGLDGTSVTVDAGPAVLAVYGAAPQATSLSDSMPTLVIAETHRPTASTSGASLQQLEDFLLAQPGVSPQLAAEIRAIGQPSSTLPIPIIAGAMTSQTIEIDGVQGVVSGDSSGLGSAVIWEKDGVVYAVGGLLPQSEVVDIARSLR
jgi:hypothetical protein